MTLVELYAQIDGDYDQAIKVLRIEKLIDKHIRRLPGNAIFADLADAGKSLDANRIFESAHAIKGVCSNLGLAKLSHAAAQLCDEFRPGNARSLSDDAVRQKVAEIGAMFDKAVQGIHEYEQAAQ